MAARESLIGNRIFERVEEMRAAEPGLTQQEAFLRLGTEMDRKPATIGANYYRVMRNRKKAEADAKRAEREARKQEQAERKMEPVATRRGPNRNKQIADSLDEMAQVMHRQIDTMVAQYKAEHQQLMKVRELIGG